MTTIWKIMKKFNTKVIILNINNWTLKTCSDHKIWSEVEKVLSNKSHCGRVQGQDFSSSSIRRIMNQDLNPFPYHITAVHILIFQDKTKHVDMSQNLHQKMKSNFLNVQTCSC